MAEQISFTVPSPYQAELADMARRQRMAEIMQQQAFQPAETFSYNGIQARTSPLTGLAKALQGYMAGKTQRDILQEQKALGEKYRTQSAEEGTQFMRALRGTPAVEGTEGVKEYDYKPNAFDLEQNPQLLSNLNPQQQAEVNLNQMPTLISPAQKGLAPQPAVGPDLARALEMSMGSINPMVQSAGGALLAQMVKGPESAFGKIDPKDYTKESLQAFIAGGGKNPAILDPVRKQEMATTVGPNGQTISVPFNPYAPPPQGFVQPMGGFVGILQQLGMLTPEMMQNPQVQQILSGYIGKETGQVTPVESQRLLIDLARLRNQAISTQAETGMSAPIPSMPQPFNLFGAPQVNAPTVMNAPGAAPNAARGAMPAAPTGQQGMGLPVDLSRTGLPLKTQRDIQKELVTGEVKKQLEAKEALPMQMAQGQDMLNLIDRMVGTVDKKGNVITEPHAGISVVGSAIGRLGAVVPGSKGADFISMLNQVKGQSFLEAIQRMRASGPVGAITDIEGAKAESAVNRMNVAQSREEFTRAARDFQNSMRRAMADAQRRAGGLSQGAQDALNAVMRK